MDNLRTRRVDVMTNGEEFQLLTEAAEAESLSRGAFVRRAALEAARSVLAKFRRDGE